MRWHLVVLAVPFLLVGLRLAPLLIWTVGLRRKPGTPLLVSMAMGCMSAVCCVGFLAVGVALLLRGLRVW
ncbi:hypothetical protein FJZ36_06030 [Candidatus Poribacteria bacterium]|nr:hypothetical protein [Candidatus Poribacteria bacterium]